MHSPPAAVAIEVNSTALSTGGSDESSTVVIALIVGGAALCLLGGAVVLRRLWSRRHEGEKEADEKKTPTVMVSDVRPEVDVTNVTEVPPTHSVI
jgi:hypothetical protein